MDQYEKMIVNLQGEMDHREKNNKKNDDLFKQKIYKLEGNLVLNEVTIRDWRTTTRYCTTTTLYWRMKLELAKQKLLPRMNS